MQVDQVRRKHVHAEHVGKGVAFVAWRFCDPRRSVVDDRAQAVGVGFKGCDEGQDPGFTGKIRKHAERAAFAQGRNAGAFAAVAENHRMALVQQAFGAMQADTLAGAGNQDRGVRCSHGGAQVAGRLKLYQRPATPVLTQQLR